MTESPEEKARSAGYVEGRRRTLLNQLSQAISDLLALGAAKQEDPEIQIATLILERQETIAKLRDLCNEYGSNEWPENLHLADIIEYHLVRPMLEEG